MEIIDAFLFYNELDLLEIRLNILDDVVDKFVLVEAKKTFMGKEKTLYYQKNKERFKKWEHKIIHYVVDEPTDEEWEHAKKSPNVGIGNHWWVREFYQKESMIKPLLENCNDNDIVFISDLDEIWNPNIKINVKDGEVYKPHLVGYYYFLNNRSDHEEGWVGTRYGTFKTLKQYGANHFRTEREIKSIKVEPSGWHFGNIGDSSFLKQKLEAYGHQEWNNEQIKGQIESCIKENKDFAGRGFNLWVDESQLPDYLIKNKEQWKKLFR